jgi:segregation and condensation protein B
MKREEQLRIVEALIVASADPIPATRLASIVPGLSPSQARECVEALNGEYEEQDRAFEIWEVAGGFQLRTRSQYKGYAQQLLADRPLRLSRAALETLAVVAYKQPSTRAEIEHVRGVDVGAVLRGLLERGLVRVAGHREVPGRPILYGTTRRFLEVFGLGSLSDLPTLRELAELVPDDALGQSSDPEPASAPDPATVSEALEPGAHPAPQEPELPDAPEGVLH